MNKIATWQLPKAERLRIEKLRKNLEGKISNAIDEVSRCQNKLNNAIYQRENLKNQLFSLENQYEFDSP